MAWTLDEAHTTVSFTARHMGLSKVRGQFTRFSGEVEGDPNHITSASGRFEIEMSSVETGNADRDAHLRAGDFFDVEKFPTMTFVGRSITPAGDRSYTITGDLTIKDVTREVALRYEHGGEDVDPYGNRKIGGTLTGTIKRSEWGLTWNVPLDSGGLLISDNIKLEIDLQIAETKEAVEEEAKAEAELSV